LGKERKENVCETSDLVHGQTVTIVSTKKEALLGRILAESGFDVIYEILVVYEKNIVSRLVHSLEEAVAAIVQAIKHVRKIVMLISSKAVFRWSRENSVSVLCR
jgi:hypothetical protein